MQKIIPFLWFDKEAEEAVKFYTSVFKDSKIKEITRFDEDSAKASGQPKGSVMTVSFELFSQQFAALNGGPMFKFTPAISFLVNCKDQKEVDYYWGKLTADGGKEDMCGWLTDKYGVSWQIVPEILDKLLADKDKNKAQRTMRAMLEMKKIDIKKLEDAYKGK